MSPLWKQGSRAKKLDSRFRGDDKSCFRNKDYLGMLCIPRFSSLSIKECHNILPCKITSMSLTPMKISLIQLLSKTH